MPPTVFVVDPPWKLKDDLPWGGSTSHYKCMKLPDIVEYVTLATLDYNDCVLCLWRLSSMQDEALSVCREAGFKVKSEFDWQKLTVKGKPHFGMGRYTRLGHEICLIATRGKCLPEVHNVRSEFSAPIGKHSRKPDKFYSLVEQMWPSSDKIELFARVKRDGWTQYGDQLGSIL